MEGLASAASTMTPFPDPFDLDVPEPGAGRVVLHDTPWVLLLFPETRSLVWVDLTRMPHTNVGQQQEQEAESSGDAQD